MCAKFQTNKVRVSAPTIKDSPSIVQWTGNVPPQSKPTSATTNRPSVISSPPKVNLTPGSAGSNEKTTTSRSTDKIYFESDFIGGRFNKENSQSGQQNSKSTSTADDDKGQIQTLTTTRDTIPKYLDSELMRRDSKKVCNNQFLKF